MPMTDLSKDNELLVKELKELRKEHFALKALYEKDSAERYHIEESLQQSQTFLNSIIEHSPNSMWIADEHGTLIRLNQAFRDNLRLKDDEVIGKYNIFNDNLVEEQGFMPMVRDVFEKGIAARFTIQYDTSAVKNLNTAQTVKVFLEVNISAIVNSQGKVTHAIVQHHDITEQRMFAQALMESEEKYRSMFENVQDVFYQIDLDGIIQDISPSVKRLSDYNRDELIGTKVADFYYFKEERELFLKEIMAKGVIRDYELTMKTKNGDIRFTSVSASLIRDAQGKPTHIDGALRDITERKIITDELIKSKNELENFFNLVPDLVVEASTDGYFKLLNPEWEKILGYSIQELQSEPFESFIHPDDILPTRQQVLRQIEGNRTIRFENRYRHKDGSYRMLEWNAAPSKEGILYAAAHDITDRKLAEDALRTSEEKFRNITEQFKDVIFITDSKGEITYISPSAQMIFGYSPQEMTGVTFMKFLDERDLQNAVSQFQKSMATGTTREIRTFLMKHKDGSTFIGELSSVLFYKNNVPMGTMGLIRDITVKKQEEQELKNAKEKAEESDRLKSAFLANMSHEIRTPMNGILGFAELLKQPQLSGEEQQEYIRVILRSGKRMLNIINDIVDISKIESGQFEITISETNINEQLEFIYTFFKAEAERKGLKFSVIKSLPSKEVIIKSDREKIYAVLTNLIKNSLKYTKAGSIECGYEKKGKFLEFYVKDTGSGVSEQQREIIFERFRQANDLNTQFSEGAGLGLSISKNFVEMLGGRIWIESEIGKGSMFYFTIPFDTENENEIISKNVSPQAGVGIQGENLKILIADDDPDSEMLISTVVKMYGKEILKAATGVEAVETCRANPDIDLILMDVRMPELDGYSATHQIREFNKTVVIIAQTGFAMAGDRENALNAGCNDYLSKPIKIDELKGLIQKYFSA